MKLKLEDVEVTSFVIPSDAEADARGTVHGQQIYTRYPRYSCPIQYTCPECASPFRPEAEAEA